MAGHQHCVNQSEKRLTSVKGKLLIISGGGGILLSVFACSNFFSNSFNFSSPISAFLFAILSFSSPSILADRAADGFPMTVRHGAETKYLAVSTARRMTHLSRRLIQSFSVYFANSACSASSAKAVGKSLPSASPYKKSVSSVNPHYKNHRLTSNHGI